MFSPTNRCFDTRKVRRSSVFGKASFLASFPKVFRWGVPGNFLQQKKVTTTEKPTEAVFCTSCWKSRSYNTFLLQVEPNFSCTLFTAFETVCSWSETCLLTSWLPKNSKKTVFSCPKSMDAYSSLQSNILQRTWWFLNDRTLKGLAHLASKSVFFLDQKKNSISECSFFELRGSSELRFRLGTCPDQYFCFWWSWSSLHRLYPLKLTEYIPISGEPTCQLVNFW